MSCGGAQVSYPAECAMIGAMAGHPLLAALYDRMTGSAAPPSG
jgi:hypothetical protein